MDLYRTILRLDDLRQNVFRATGGSMLILSPLGSKVMALGALLAALERDLPVAHLESIGYELEASVPETMDPPSLIHVWLEGEVYPQPRPALSDGMESFAMTTVIRPKVFGTGLIALDLVVGPDPESPVRAWAGGTCGNVYCPFWRILDGMRTQSRE